MSKDKEIKISKAKGRPMLTWVGKKPLKSVRAYPAQHIESFSVNQEISLADCDWSDWPEKFDKGGLLFHGDNKDVLAHLLANGFRGKVKLIYIDPPFDSGADYVRKVQLRGVSGAQKIGGEEYTLGEQIQYTDIWANDNYLQFMYERLMLLRELLSEEGSIYVHCDSKRVHFLRCILEEIFGVDNFQSQIAWQRSTPKGNMSRGLGSAYDSILFFTKSDASTWNPIFLDHSKEYVEKYYSSTEMESNRKYQLTSLLSPATNRPNLTYEFHGHKRVWRYTKERMLELEKNGRVIVPKEGGMPREKRYLDEMKGISLQDLWTDIYPVNSMAEEREDYPTQKPESLLERILTISSNKSDLILDCFIGSGTTCTAAQTLNRRWIGCDINKGAIQTTAKRLQSVMNEQANLIDENKQQVIVEEKNSPSQTSQLSFSTWRVNDYDLQIQHNEAVDLACEYIGIARNRSDSFFDGSRGKRLVKIIPFNHPLTPLDLESIRTELACPRFHVLIDKVA